MASHQFLIDQRRGRSILDVDEMMLLEAVRRSMVEEADDFTEEERAFISQTENIALDDVGGSNADDVGSEASQAEHEGSRVESTPNEDKTVVKNAETQDEVSL
jgi:hypothetical protein